MTYVVASIPITQAALNFFMNAILFCYSRSQNYFTFSRDLLAIMSLQCNLVTRYEHFIYTWFCLRLFLD